MQLGIDITSLLYGRGVSRYTRNLLQALDQTNQFQFSLYGCSLRRRTELQQQIKSLKLHHAKSVLQPLPVSLVSRLWQTGLNPIKPKMPAIEVFHAWDWHLPPDVDLPMVTTMHDLAMLRFPEIAHPAILRAHQVAWNRIKQSKTQIIAVSQTTKQDCIELLEIEPKRVSVVYEALPVELTTASQTLTEDRVAAIHHKFALERPYFLFVGTTEPRKNLKRVIKAWQSFADDYDLVIVGAPGWDDLASVKTKRDPILLPSVNDEELSALYSQAQLFVFPSLYEGFGLPILEAFYHGTPVVTSNNSGMAEVAGNAAALVDPLSVESIRAGLTTIVKETQAEQKVRDQRMILRLQVFRWEETARKTTAVYQRAIESWHSS